MDLKSCHPTTLYIGGVIGRRDLDRVLEEINKHGFIVFRTDARDVTYNRRKAINICNEENWCLTIDSTEEFDETFEVPKKLQESELDFRLEIKSESKDSVWIRVRIEGREEIGRSVDGFIYVTAAEIEANQKLSLTNTSLIDRMEFLSQYPKKLQVSDSAREHLEMKNS